MARAPAGATAKAVRPAFMSTLMATRSAFDGWVGQCFGPPAGLQGSTRRTPRSLKCRMLRVATGAFRARAIPAIWASRISTASPARWRRATTSPAASAAATSKARTRWSRSSLRTRSKASSRRRRRREGVKSSKPVRISNTVTDVVQIDSDGWVSSQSTTAVSGSDRMSADSTLVSSRIMVSLRGPPLVPGGHATRRSRARLRGPGTATRSSTQAEPVRSVSPARRRAGSLGLLLQWSAHGHGPSAGVRPSHRHRVGGPRSEPRCK